MNGMVPLVDLVDGKLMFEFDKNEWLGGWQMRLKDGVIYYIPNRKPAHSLALHIAVIIIDWRCVRILE